MSTSALITMLTTWAIVLFFTIRLFWKVAAAPRRGSEKHKELSEEMT